MTGFKAPDKITKWNQDFDYDAYLEDQTQKEYQEELRKIAERKQKTLKRAEALKKADENDAVGAGKLPAQDPDAVLKMAPGQELLGIDAAAKAALEEIGDVSEIATPASSRTSADSFMQRDPRNKHFSLVKVRQDLEKL